MSLTSFVPIINRVCFHAYTLGLLLAVLTMGLTPIHQTLRSRADITRTYGGGTSAS